MCISIFFKHILAVIHFNYNLGREAKTNPDGSTQVTVIYPKFKNGTAVVKDQKIDQNVCEYSVYTCIYCILLYK